MKTVRDGDRVVVFAEHYSLEISGGSLYARIYSTHGEVWADLCLLSAVDTVGGRDETVAAGAPEVGEQPDQSVLVVVPRASNRWTSSAAHLRCREDRIETWTTVEGHGQIDAAWLHAGWSSMPAPNGPLHSGRGFQTLFSPNPGNPRRLTQSADVSAPVGVVGDSHPGRGHWFFTPAPLCFAAALHQSQDPGDPCPGGWMLFGITAPISQLPITGFNYVAGDAAFSLRLDYEGHTTVNGNFQTPPVSIGFGAPDAYRSIARYRSYLTDASLIRPSQSEPASWWSDPIFSGWGAQCHLASLRNVSPKEFSTQRRYDDFLEALSRGGLEPATVVIDDKWQRSYGGWEPDPGKWPDLREWIAERHRRGNHVILWWKAWDPASYPPRACVRNVKGQPVAVDPQHPEGRSLLIEAVTQLLSSEHLDADGLKIDFTASTPSGQALEHHGKAWGISLLYEQIAVIYQAAKRAKNDSLIITHIPCPHFSEVTDMVRLNDMLRLDDLDPVAPIVPQMRYRAEVARQASPGTLIDTDDWCVPDLDSWREYVQVKPRLGVPSLYYATHLDYSGEELTEADYSAVAETWSRAGGRAATHPEQPSHRRNI